MKAIKVIIIKIVGKLFKKRWKTKNNYLKRVGRIIYIKIYEEREST